MSASKTLRVVGQSGQGGPALGKLSSVDSQSGRLSSRQWTCAAMGERRPKAAALGPGMEQGRADGVGALIGVAPESATAL